MDNKHIYIAAEKRKWSLFFAVFIHMLLLTFVFFGVHWQNQPVKPLEVEIWEGIPVKPAGAGIDTTQVFSSVDNPPSSMPPALSEPEPVLSSPTEPKAEPDITIDTPPEQKTALAKPEIKLTVEKKVRLDQPKKPNRAVAEEKTQKDQKAETNPLDFQTLLKGAATHSQQGKLAIEHAPATTNGQVRGTVQRAGSFQGSQLESYLNQLKQRIRDKTIYPDNGPGNPSAVLKIVVLPDGTIRDVQIVSQSGDPAFAHARKQAVLMMQQLPPLPDGVRFSEQREWTVRTRLKE